VEAEDDALARKALRWRLEHETRAAALRRELKEAEGTNQALRRGIDGMRLKLAEARRKLAVLAARQRTADARKRVHSRAQGAPGSAFEDFARLEERIERSEAEADALAGLQAGLAAETEEAEAAAQLELAIEEELARLKLKQEARATGSTS
jgi:phage shock protein A